MQIADLHTHTYLCKHAIGEPEEYVDAALIKGESWYGISDHCPWASGFDPDSRMEVDQFPLYKEIVKRMQKRAEGTSLKVLYAMELDYIPEKKDEIQNAFKDEDFDYLIGSIHQTEFFPFDHSGYLEDWKQEGFPEHVWSVYTKYLKDYVSSWDFQIIGHCDLPKKFGYKPVMSESFLNSMREIFEIASARGIALELNANGLYVPVQEIYPSPTLLKLAQKAGMDVTYGSDSHAPEHVGRSFDKVLTLARECGFSHFATFEKKQKIRIPIS